MQKVSVFYLEKQKVLFISRIFLGHFQHQNKKALFTDPIFSDGSGCFYSVVVQVQIYQIQIDLVFETVIKN